MSHANTMFKRFRGWQAAALLWLAGLPALGFAAACAPWATLSDAAFHRALSGNLGPIAMAQDAEGLLWIGTQSGLLRWDGHKLRKYASDGGQPGTLPDSFVQSLHVDRQGRLWVGTNAGGVARFDAGTDRFVFPLAAGQAPSGKGVEALVDDGQGGLWMGTVAGLDRVDMASGQVQHHAGFAGPLGLPAAAVHDALIDVDGTLWVATSKGLYRKAKGQPRFAAVALPTADRIPPHVLSLYSDNASRLWAGTRGNGAYIVQPGRDEGVPLDRMAPKVTPPLGGLTVRRILPAADGEVWMGTDGVGVVRVATDGSQVRYERHREQVSSSLPDDDVFAMLHDRRGVLWVATDTGISFHDANQRVFTTWLGGPAHPGGLSHGNVPFVMPMADGLVWLSTGDGGIDIVDPRRGRVGGFHPDPANPETALPPGRVLGMVVAPSGEVWIGTQRGLYRADAAGRQVQRMQVPGRAAIESVRAMAWQGDRLWIGGLDGLWGLVPDGQRPMRVVARQEGEQLGDPRITALLADGPGTLWIGTRQGVRVWSAQTGAVRPLPTEAPGRPGIPESYISALVLDSRGRLWVGAFGGGVRIVTQPSATVPAEVRRITTADGLPHNGVNMLTADRQGHMWASTDAGLARVSIDSLETTAYGAAEGVGVLNYWTASGGTTPDGHVLFGGGGGLTIVDPDALRPRHVQAPLLVTELRLGDDPPMAHLPDAGGGTRLEIQPDRRSVLVEFAALDYTAPLAVRYQYRMKGLDRDWIATDATRRIAAYTNLPPGDYVLEIRSGDAAGAWSAPLQLPLHVRPMWYETTGARVAMWLGLAALMLGLVHVRTLYLRRRQRVLEGLVALRTEQLEESQRQLEKIAYFDGLTGLANRRLFNDELRRLLATMTRHGHGFALLLIDLDRFKQINDTLGHDAGDAVLEEVARRLTAAVREADRVARLGGDEFAVLLPDTPNDEAVEAVCSRIVETMKEPMDHLPSHLQPGASVGAALAPRHADTPDTLYKAADVALYEAKRSGRGCWRMAAEPEQREVEAADEV